ncbi:MAG: sulfotransferase domain-containing protein [Planctomycetes bacterium]|nr:sulfotransferase domain-containing protein [Planctomycetota bacterium]
MEGDAVALDRECLFWCLQQPEVPHHLLTSLCPDFLVISPPKTGSTWLAANFRCHPQLFVPSTKECRYFSSFFKWFDLSWYLNHFDPGTDRVKGEASPSYALLPVGRIRLIRRLLPQVKLIFLMREPVGRAWSHAKHNYRYREASFAGCTAPFDAVTDDQWRENFTHDWPLASGDYLGQLLRWRSVFPRAQLYVGFYESIARQPELLLRDLFRFLGVNPEVDLSSFPVREKILTGLPGKLTPSLERSLHQLLHNRTLQLASFLREHFNLEAPPEWRGTLESSGEKEDHAPVSVSPEAFRREFDDGYLARVLEQEERFPAAPRPVLAEYRGYNIVFHRRRLVAVEHSLDPACLDSWGPAEVQRHQDRGSLFFGLSLAEVKDRVNRHVFERFQAVLRTTEALSANLHQAHERIASIEHALRQRPWYISALRFIRNTWRRFRAALSADASGQAVQQGNAPQPGAAPIGEAIAK